MDGNTGMMRRGADEPHGGELTGGSYLNHPHHGLPAEEKGKYYSSIKKLK